MKRRQCFITIIVSLFTVSLSCAEEVVDAWRYTLQQPADDWHQVDFDDAAWTTGSGGFGTRSTPGARVETVWTTNDIWLRRMFTLDSMPEKPALLIHHDEDAAVYINGQSVAVLTGFTREYGVVPIEERGVLKPGQAEVFLDAQHERDTFGYLLVYLDDKLIYDDMSRHKKAEYRVTCVPLTDEQAALLTRVSHELKIEVTPSVTINSLDVSLDAVVEP